MLVFASIPNNFNSVSLQWRHYWEYIILRDSPHVNGKGFMAWQHPEGRMNTAPGYAMAGPQGQRVPSRCHPSRLLPFEFLGLLKHKESYFFLLHLIFFVTKLLKLYKRCKPIFSDTDSECQASFSLLWFSVGRSQG